MAATAAGDLRLAMTAAPAWAEPGEVVTFTVTLSNTGAAALPALVVTAALPAGLEYVPAGGSRFRYDNRSRTLTWSVGDLAAGQGVMGGLQARVQGLAVGATVTVAVTASGPTLKEALTAAAAVDVVPPRGDTVWVTPEGGGLLRSADDRVLVKVPPGAVRARTKLTYTARPAQNGLLAVWALDTAPEETPAPRPSNFGQPVELQIRPMPDETPRGLTPLRLLAWDERAGAWQVLAGTADPTRGTLSTWVFGSGVYALAGNGPTYGVTILPSLKAFTSELWSAAAVVSYDLDVPAGPAGLGLNLRLVYNSQGINILSQVAGGSYRSQASWVGLGWELAGIGSISRPLGKAGPYTLSFGGGAFEIKDVGGVLTTEPQGFLKIEHSGGLTWNTQPWIVRTPDGMKYTFGNPAGTVGSGTAYEPFWTGWNQDCSVRTYQWGLTRIEDPAGNRWDITWAHEMKSVSSVNGCPGDAGQYMRASYPETLSLTPAGVTAATVRVRLVREPRNDKNICKYDDPYQINTFGDGRLKQIVVEAYTAGAWRLVRRYDLGYTYDSTTLGCGTDQGSGNHSLLTSITQYGANGTSALPAYTFGYQGSGNSVRLRTANNGYGGQVQFTYSPQWVGNNAGCTSYQWQVVTGQTVTNGSTAHGLGLFSTTVYTPTGAYAYVTPVGCNNGAEIPRETYEFLGHTAVEEVIKDAAGQVVAQRRHRYDYQYNTSTGKPDARKGKETLVVTMQPGGGELARTETEWRIQTVNGVEWPYTSAITQTLGSVTTVTRYEYAPAYQGGAQYGNVTHIREYAGATATTPYRTTLRQYVPNTTAWIVNKPAYSHVYAGDLPADLNQMAAGTWYIYSDNQTNPSPHWNQPVGNKGQLRGVRRYVRTTNGILEFADTRYKHDAYGNVIEEQTYRSYGTATAWASTVANTVTTDYDTTFRVYPIQQTITPGAAGGATLTTTYRYYGVNAEAGQGSGLVGQLQSITDPNNAVTRLTYDAFGRVTEIRKPGAGWTNPATEKYVYSDSPAPLAVKHSLRDDANGDNSSAATYLEDWTYYDGLGQVIQTQRESASGSQSIVASTQYHPLGGVRQQNVPYFYPAAGGTYRTPDWNQPKTQYAYDALGRVTRVTHPDGTGVSTYYRDRQVAVIDALHRQTIREMDAFGRLQRVKEFSGSYPNGPGWGDPAYATTNYAYDVLDHLTQVTDAAGNVTTITYDALGRKTGMRDPDMGTWSYAYDAAGNLTQQTDARGCLTTFTYDGLNRLTQKSYSGPGACGTTPAVTYTYDSTANGNKGIGRRTGMSDASGSTNWVYDQRGRVTQEQKVVNGSGGGTFTTQWGYDAMDRVAWMKYPGGNGGQVGEQVNFAYNAAGLVNTVIGSATYVGGTAYNALGQVTERRLGSTTGVLRQLYTYTAAENFRLTALQSGTSPNYNNLQNLTYSYDDIGNVLTITDAAAVGGSQTQTFTYDFLDRLLSAGVSGGSGGQYSESYEYSGNNGKIGNLTRKGATNYTYGTQSASCPDGALTKPHAVVTAGANTYCYDRNGNMVRRNGTAYTLSYDAENRLTQVSGGASATFVYDGDGQRVKATVNGTTTVYIGNYYEQTGSTIRKYYYANGRRIAMRVGGTLYWLLTDHLGSTAITTNSSGSRVAELRYKAWGETRYTYGTTPTTYRFTGQREDATIGLYFYNARYYDPVLGRFISADSIVPEPGNPQALNRYAYVYNNPLRYTDPTGHCPWCIPVAIGVLKLVDWGWTAWDVYQSGRTLSDPNASDLDRQLAELNIILALSLEAGEPDDILPVAVPADDVTRRGLIRVAREALAAGDEAALHNLPDWMRPIVRGLVTEDRILAQLGRQGQKRLIEGQVGNELVKTIPDFVDDANKIVGEIKDVAELGWDKQIQAQFEWAQRHGYTYQLIIRRSTIRQGNLAGNIEDLRKRGIDIRFIEDMLP